MHLGPYARLTIFTIALSALVTSASPASADLPPIHPNARPMNPTGITVALTTSVRCPNTVAATATVAGTKGAYFHYRFRNSAGATSKFYEFFNGIPATATSYDAWAGAPPSGWFVVEAAPWPPVAPKAGYNPFPPGQNTKWTVISNEAHFTTAACLKAPVNTTH